MYDWLRNQQWSEEFLVAGWVLAVIVFAIVLWGYGNILKH